MDLCLSSTRVLSIQSHVVHGYVGNKCAVFALQLHGIEVDPINSVQFSNHTGYPTFKGEVLSATKLGELYEGLVLNNLNNYTHVLTGYVNSVETLFKIVDIIRDLKTRNPNLKYFCDPVMGDGGKLYGSVPPTMVDLYKQHVLPLANTIKLNQTELEHLTGITIGNEQDAWKAIEQLHGFGAENVVVSSVEFLGPALIGVLASSKKVDHPSRYVMQVERRGGYFSGTGDLFSALLLAWLDKSSNKSLGSAVQHVVSTIQHVLEVSNDEMNAKLRLKEIRLVKSASNVLKPTELLPIEERTQNQ